MELVSKSLLICDGVAESTEDSPDDTPVYQLLDGQFKRTRSFTCTSDDTVKHAKLPLDSSCGSVVILDAPACELDGQDDSWGLSGESAEVTVSAWRERADPSIDDRVGPSRESLDEAKAYATSSTSDYRISKRDLSLKLDLPR